jgi:hypothetical protein
LAGLETNPPSRPTRASQVLLSGLLLMSLSCAKQDASKAPGPSSELLYSVLVRPDAVFATSPKGLFRASAGTRKWVEVQLGDDVPRCGYLAGRAVAGSAVYYYAPRTIAWNLPSEAKKTFGLYRSADNGTKWELLTSEYDFFQVYVHEDDVIYGITELFSRDKTNNATVPAPILMSTDGGKNWRDIRGGTRGLEFQWIFPDPDHKDLICVQAWGLRGYILQANDTNYTWAVKSEYDWWQQHQTNAPSLDAAGSYGLAGYGGILTLANYFDLASRKRSKGN